MGNYLEAVGTRLKVGYAESFQNKEKPRSREVAVIFTCSILWTSDDTKETGSCRDKDALGVNDVVWFTFSSVLTNSLRSMAGSAMSLTGGCA